MILVCCAETLAFDLNTGRRVGYTELPHQPVDLELTQTGIRMSVHGQFPVEEGNPKGYIVDWARFDARESRARMVVKGLHRVTEHHTYDLNGDGLEDIVATMFGDGNLAVGGGRFSIFWQTPEYAEIWEDAPVEIPVGPLEGALRETVLLERAGILLDSGDIFGAEGKGFMRFNLACSRATLEEALARRGFRFIEILAPCPTAYGRRNKMRAPLDLLKYFEGRAIVRHEADPAEAGIDMEGSIVIGKFVDRERPTFLDLWSKRYAPEDDEEERVA